VRLSGLPAFDELGWGKGGVRNATAASRAASAVAAAMAGTAAVGGSFSSPWSGVGARGGAPQESTCVVQGRAGGGV